MKRIIFAFVSIAVLTSCSSTKVKKAADAPTEGYQSYSSGSFKMFPFKEVVLENGLKIIFIHDASLPRVSLTTLIKSGVMQDPRGLEGLNAMTASLLEQGTQTKSANQVADAFGQMGTDIAIAPSAETTLIFSDALSTSADELLKVYTDVIMNPSFSDAEINRVRARVLASLQKKIDDPSSYASSKMDELIFGTHPYAFEDYGTIASIRKIRKQDILRHYLTFFRPNNASLAVVGSFDSDFEEKVKTTFAAWTKRKQPTLKIDRPPENSPLAVTLLTKKGLQQAQIRFGQLGIKRTDADYLKLRVANEVLGGSFASRLNQRVRDDLGLTYSVGSSYQSLADSGAFNIQTFTKNETVGRTIEETTKVLEDVLEKGITEQELKAAKNQIIGQFPQAIETSDKLAYNLLMFDFFGVPVSYLTDFNKNINSMSLGDVNQALKRHLDPKTLKVLVYADPSVASQLKTYKLEVKKAQ